MKVIILVCLIGCAAAAGPYVVDLLKNLNPTEIAAILANKADGQYPTLAAIPESAQNFDCSSKKGFYADVSHQCQVFHRCDVNGNHTAYLCVNSTLFNQITLICDYFFNVDCERNAQYEELANSRLYTDKPLFDDKPIEEGKGADDILANKPAVSKIIKN